MRHTITAILLLALPLPSSAYGGGAEADTASAPRPDPVVTNAKMLGVGYNSTQDTYLSPLHYAGPELRYVSHTIRRRDDSPWLRLIINEGRLAEGESRSENGALLAADYRFAYAALHSWHLCDNRITIHAGGGAEALAGMLYNTRNGNNPVQARCLINITATARAEMQLHKVRLAYEASAPLVGITFSPNYGQSYYEIFSEGHYDHNIVPTTLAAMPSLRHSLTADIPFLNTTWRIGYLGDYRQQAVNNLKQHSYTSALVIGIVHTFTAGRRSPR